MPDAAAASMIAQEHGINPFVLLARWKLVAGEGRAEELRRERAGLALDLYEERAAIREHDGGQDRPSAEVGALEEAACAVGTTPERLCRDWAAHPDARAMLALLAREGPMSYGAAARALGWGATRARQAEARLDATGLIYHDHLGRMVLTAKGKVA